MSKVIFALFSLWLSAIVSGCATHPPLTDDARDALRQVRSERVAVNYFLVRKQINYQEVLYRVLWLETKSSTRDFSGIWSADEDLTGLVVDGLANQGFKAESIYASLSSRDNIVKYNERRAAHISSHAIALDPKNPEVKIIPTPSFFVGPIDDKGSDEIYSELKSKGFRYSLEIAAMDLYANAPGYGLVIVQGAPNISIVDLASKKVVWSKQLFHQQNYQLGGDLTLLEIDGMKKAKEGLKAGLEKWNYNEIFSVQ
jgi:hypothetical protein